MPQQKQPEIKTQVELLLESIDLLDGDKDYLKRFGPPIVYGLGATYTVLLMVGVEMPNAVHALAMVVGLIGGWFTRHTVDRYK